MKRYRIDNKTDDNGYIDLLDIFGDELTIVNAARVSFNVQHDTLENRDINLIKYLYKNKHMSPFRHVMLRFKIYAPEFVMRQLYKHVVGIEATSASVPVNDSAFNEVSGRYVRVTEFYTPSVWRVQHSDNKQGSGEPCDDSVQTIATNAYAAALAECLKAYTLLLDAGICFEQSRTILPLSQMTTVVWTCSLQALFNFIHLRNTSHAQAEIRAYAQIFDQILHDTFPNVYECFHNDY